MTLFYWEEIIVSEVNLSGGRYVYFKTVKEPYYSFGLGILSSINSMLQPQQQETNSINTHLDNISKYIKFIQEMATSARNNELAFLSQQFSILAKSNNSNPKIENWLKQLQSGKIDENSYQEIYNMFNTLLKNSQYAQVELEKVLHNLNTTKNIFLQLPNKIRQQLYKAHDENMQFYRSLFFKEGTKIDKQGIQEYCNTLSNQLAQKINRILKLFTKDNNFKSIFTEALSQANTLDLSDEQFKSIVVNYILDFVLTEGLDDTVTIQTLSNRIANGLIYNLQDIIEKYNKEQDARAIFSPEKSLEEIALTTNASLGNYLAKLEPQSLLEIKKMYAETDSKLANDIQTLIDKIDNTKTEITVSRSLKNNITRRLRQSIRNRAKQAAHLETEIPKIMSKTDFSSKFSNIDNFITRTHLRSAILDGLSGLSISHDAVAELLGKKEFGEHISNVVSSSYGGKTYKFKADFQVSTGAFINNLSNVFDENKVATIINNVLQDQYNNFYMKYQEITGGQTDIEAAMTIYTEQIERMQKQIDEIIELDSSIKDKDKAKQDVYRELHETFSTGVSVKDYNLYNNTLGHHGGSLGSYTAPQQVMKNIYTMYKLGGITAIDVNMLMTAVINCGDAMIGSFLRPTLETYLLGGAALIMFDDSFAQSDVFLKNMSTELKGQKVVNLYRLESRYVPSSMILTQIGNSLKQIYSDIINNNPLTNANNRVTIINNINESILQSEKIKELSPQKQWETVRDITENSINIHFSFMAGLLDILEGIPAAFDVS